MIITDNDRMEIFASEYMEIPHKSGNVHKTLMIRPSDVYLVSYSDGTYVVYNVHTDGVLCVLDSEEYKVFEKSYKYTEESYYGQKNID